MFHVQARSRLAKALNSLQPSRFSNPLISASTLKDSAEEDALVASARASQNGAKHVHDQRFAILWDLVPVIYTYQVPSAFLWRFFPLKELP